MAGEYADLALWLVGLFGIVIAVAVAVNRAITKDTFSYDERFVWKRKTPKE